MNKWYQSHKAEIREWIESIVVALLLAIFIRTFFIQAFKIPSGSMRPTLIEGDRLLVNKLRYGPQIPFTDWRLPGMTKPKRGDVIVFKFPDDPKRDFIKRLIAVGGETVEIIDGKIFINDRMATDLPNTYTYYYNYGDYAVKDEKFVVPEGTFFVLGDNSASSHDSRYWGVVPEELLIGRAEIIYWPPNRLRFIK